MLNRDPARELPRPTPPRGRPAPVPTDRIASFKRLYRWLNLTLVHHAPWPLLLLAAGAPATAPATTPWPWFAARLGAPAAAALLALVYLAQRPLGRAATTEPSPSPVDAGSGRGPALRRQARVVLLGLPIMVGVARLVAGPALPAAKLLAFGAADVAAFHLIHFGVVARSFPDREQAQAVAVLLFGVSWGLREALLAGAGREAGAELPLAFAGGLAVGLAFAALARLLRRWPGGWLPAAATHWLLVYAVFGFVD